MGERMGEAGCLSAYFLVKTQCQVSQSYLSIRVGEASRPREMPLVLLEMPETHTSGKVKDRCRKQVEH